MRILPTSKKSAWGLWKRLLGPALKIIPLIKQRSPLGIFDKAIENYSWLVMTAWNRKFSDRLLKRIHGFVLVVAAERRSGIAEFERVASDGQRCRIWRRIPAAGTFEVGEDFLQAGDEGGVFHGKLWIKSVQRYQG
jgi:hypothetical protein